MKRKDHKALGGYLLDSVGAGDRNRISPLHRRCFLVGCVIPDLLPFTYLRGWRESRGLRGHDAPYLKKGLEKRLSRLRRFGVSGGRGWFSLGIAMHYLADSRTYPHTCSFSGGFREHRRYEKELHRCLDRLLQGNERFGFEAGADPSQTPFSNCVEILQACTQVFRSVLLESEKR